MRCNVYADVNIDLTLCEHVCMVIGLQNTIKVSNLPFLCKQCMAVDSKPTIKPDDEKEDVILCEIWNLFEMSYIFIRYWVCFVYCTFIINHNHCDWSLYKLNAINDITQKGFFHTYKFCKRIQFASESPGRETIPGHTTDCNEINKIWVERFVGIYCELWSLCLRACNSKLCTQVSTSSWPNRIKINLTHSNTKALIELNCRLSTV